MTHTLTIRNAAATIAVSGFTLMALSIPATAIPDPGEPVGQGSTGTTTTIHEIEVPVDDNSVEYGQIALGAAAGMALVGTGAAVAASRRRHRQPQPA